MNVALRTSHLSWLAHPAEDPSEARVLTNARWLSEGVDVATLDAVGFLSPRNSQVDVVQSVGRVVRRAQGKDYGCIILPVTILAGMTPEQALKDNKRCKVIWSVLNALRSHWSSGRAFREPIAQRIRFRPRTHPTLTPVSAFLRL